MPRPTVISSPNWAQLPNGNDMGRFYPKRAARMGVDGYAEIECTVATTGLLQDCVVLRESPVDQGFGGAAIQLSVLFRMQPMTRDGAPVAGGKVVVPIRFLIPPPPLRRGLFGLGR